MLSSMVPEDQIRQHGLKVTASRLAVMRALIAKPHASAAEALALVRVHDENASAQSVYNALADFERAGIARKIEPAGHAARYELRVGDNHHHVVCETCGQIEDVECVTGAAPCLHADTPAGFQVNVAEVTFWGTCETCR